MAKSSRNSRLLTSLSDAISSNDENAIFDAALAVGDAGIKPAIPQLLNLLRNDPRMRVKNGAAIALREMSSNEALPILIELIENPKLANTRGTLVYALETLQWYRKYSHVLARLLTDQNYEVRTMAYRALKHASRKMSRDEKDGMMAALILLATEFHSPAELPAEVAETIRAAVPLLATARSVRAAEPALAT